MSKPPSGVSAFEGYLIHNSQSALHHNKDYLVDLLFKMNPPSARNYDFRFYL